MCLPQVTLLNLWQALILVILGLWMLKLNWIILQAESKSWLYEEEVTLRVIWYTQASSLSIKNETNLDLWYYKVALVKWQDRYALKKLYSWGQNLLKSMSLLCFFKKSPNVIGCCYQQQMIIHSFSSKSKNNKNRIGLMILQNSLTIWQTRHVIEFFTVCTKLAEMALLYSKDLTTTKNVTSSGVRPDARGFYWFRSPMPNYLS